jgi:hypothetical protein
MLFILQSLYCKKYVDCLGKENYMYFLFISHLCVIHVLILITNFTFPQKINVRRFDICMCLTFIFDLHVFVYSIITHELFHYIKYLWLGYFSTKVFYQPFKHYSFKLSPYHALFIIFILSNFVYQKAMPLINVVFIPIVRLS